MLLHTKLDNVKHRLSTYRLRFFDKIEILVNICVNIRYSQSAGQNPRNNANEFVIDNERSTAITLEKV